MYNYIIIDIELVFRAMSDEIISISKEALLLYKSVSEVSSELFFNVISDFINISPICIKNFPF